MANFLNTDGLSALWAKIKSKFYTKAEVDAAIPSASTTTPLMDGTATIGSSTNYARADHVHPSDTGKANVADVLSKTNTTSYTPTADYHPATKKYVDDSVSGISMDLVGLTDTAISSPSNGQVLQYDATNNVWVNGDASDVLYVTVTGNQNDGFATTASFDDVYAAYQNGCDIKAVNGSEVYNLSTVSASGMAFTKNSTSIIKQLTWSKSTGNINYTSWTASSISVSSLNDTTISSPSNGQVLSYDSASSKWINTTLNSGVTETRVNELIAVALAQYGDGDIASYGYTDASEVNY